MFIILISACADPVNRPEIKSLHFGCSFDARIGRTGFITAREVWGGDNVINKYKPK